MVEIMEKFSALSNIASLDSQVVEEEYDSTIPRSPERANWTAIVIKRGNRLPEGEGKTGSSKVEAFK